MMSWAAARRSDSTLYVSQALASGGRMDRDGLGWRENDEEPVRYVGSPVMVRHPGLALAMTHSLRQEFEKGFTPWLSVTTRFQGSGAVRVIIITT